MSTFLCPYCQTTLSDAHDLCKSNLWSGTVFSDEGIGKTPHLTVFDYKCAECGKRTVLVKGTGEQYNQIDVCLLPTSLAKQYPDYIPEQIRQDYEEAYKIVKLSPKASATLSRRCLQGMIHDFWNVKEKNLNAEITVLKDKVRPEEWRVMDSLRKLGNIGAHMEKDINLIVDIDSEEAEKLLKLIERLIEKWYIDRHDTETLYAEIIQTADQKEQDRNQTS